MKAKRIVPCMDIKGGRVVKGVNFEGISDIADPVEMARYYNESGADELVFYDIAASVEDRALLTDLIRRVKAEVSIPFTIGGGVHTLADFEQAIALGAGKVSINTGAIRNPELITEAAERYGSERVVVAMDVKRVDDAYHVFVGAGLKDSGIDAIEWAKKAQELGAGELVINSIDTDGVRQGFDIPLLNAICQVVSIPVVASGGAGCMADFLTLFQSCPGVESGLAASIFHRKQVQIGALKEYLRDNGVPVEGV